MSEQPTVPYRRVLPIDRGGPFEIWRIEPLVDGDATVAVDVVPVPSGLAGPPLAMKCLPPGSPDGCHAGEVLRCEARLQGRVRHPGIVPVELVEVGEWPAVVSPLAWGALDTLSNGHRTWSPPEAGMALRRLADALAALHAAGIVHGDVAPSNVLLVSGGDGAPPAIALTDFGCATESGVPGAVRGTPGAVAPEVAAGDGPGPASDVYGLGRVGQVLISATDVGGAVEECTALDAWCANLIDPDPHQRPTAAVAAATVPVGPRVRTVEFGPRPPAALDPTRRRSSRLVRASLALVVMLIVSIALSLGVTRRGPHDPLCVRSGSPGWMLPGLPRRLDVLGTGCAQQVTWSGTVLTVRGPASRDMRRYRLGRPGDVVAIAAWGCSGPPRPSLYRPGRGEVLDYSALPTRFGTVGSTPPSRRFGLVVNGRARLARDPEGCLHLEATKRVPRVSPGR